MLLAPYSAAQQTLTISTFESSGIQHIYLPILEEAYARLGVSLQIKHVPPERSLVESNSGRVDEEAARLTAIEQKVDNLIRVPTPLGAINTHVFAKSNDLEISSWHQLRPYKVVILLGYKRAEKMSQGMHRMFAHYPLQAMQLLQKGKADFAVLPALDGLQALQESGIEGIAMSPYSLEYSDLYHYLHIKHRDLIEPLNNVLQGMQRSGKLSHYRRRAIEKYLSAKDSQHVPRKL